MGSAFHQLCPRHSRILIPPAPTLLGFGKPLPFNVCSVIMAYLDEHKLLSDRQNAFRKKHSCETQLITVINDWVKILDKGGQVGTFIRHPPPPHELLKCKLCGYSIGWKTMK